MNILLSVFAISLVGTIGMILYKVASLRTASKVISSTESLEQHVGSYFQRILSAILSNIKIAYKNFVLPFFLDILRFIVIWFIRIYRKIRVNFLAFVSKRKKNGEIKNGTTSFFLKDISEHKKNLKSGNGN